jgi:hypothetical protein
VEIVSLKIMRTNYRKLYYKILLRINGQGFKSAQNVWIIILGQKAGDRETYSISEWTTTSVLCLTNSFQRWYSGEHDVV